MSPAKPLVGVWRDSLRDSAVDSSSKLVGLVLSTYMNGRGYARPGRVTLARGCSITTRTVETCVRKLETAGFLIVEWSVGGRSQTNVYQAHLPETSNDVRRSEWETANAATQTANLTTQTAKQVRPKAFESVESGTRAAVGVVARPLDDCMACGERRPLHLLRDRLLCLACIEAEAAGIDKRLRIRVTELRARMT